jgi:hypothetical protein
MSEFTLNDKLSYGRFPFSEAEQLSGHSRAKLYADVWDSKLGYLKSGRSSYIPGPILRRYLQGQPIVDLIPQYPALIIGPPSEKSRLAWKSNGGRHHSRRAKEAAQCLP